MTTTRSLVFGLVSLAGAVTATPTMAQDMYKSGLGLGATFLF